MSFRPNHTLSKLKKGEAAIGSWLQLCSPYTARLLTAQGCFDWLLVDFEHSPYDLSMAAQIFPAISDLSHGRVTPMARVASGSMHAIKHALDNGAQGILVPMVRGASEVADAVSYAKYPPAGLRGGGGMLSHYGHGVSRMEYMKRANDEVLVGVQIETADALDDLDAILDVPGLDLVFVGPNDLHMALGLPPLFWSDHEPFQLAVRRILTGCADRGIAVGTLCANASSAKQRVADGFTFVGLGSDAHFMLTKAGEEFGALHDLEEPPEGWCNRTKLP